MRALVYCEFIHPTVVGRCLTLLDAVTAKLFSAIEPRVHNVVQLNTNLLCSTTHLLCTYYSTWRSIPLLDTCTLSVTLVCTNLIESLVYHKSIILMPVLQEYIMQRRIKQESYVYCPSYQRNLFLRPYLEIEKSFKYAIQNIHVNYKRLISSCLQ